MLRFHWKFGREGLIHYFFRSIIFCIFIFILVQFKSLIHVFVQAGGLFLEFTFSKMLLLNLFDLRFFKGSNFLNSLHSLSLGGNLRFSFGHFFHEFFDHGFQNSVGGESSTLEFQISEGISYFSLLPPI